MPIVVITGLPASGKSSRAQELQHYLSSDKNKCVHLISENTVVPQALFRKNDCFADSQKEKLIRSRLISEASRLLSKDNVIILDAGNYIKGVRYELYCMTKAARTTQCVLFCCTPKEEAWTFNMQRIHKDVLSQATDTEVNAEQLNNSNVPYTEMIFNELCMRYEEPQSNYRWDSPLFVALPQDKLDLVGIYKALFETEPPPPNQSTQNPPLKATNYLFESDCIVQEIIKEIHGALQIGVLGEIRIKNSTQTAKITESLTALQLNRLRRKFIASTISTTHPPLDQVPQLFVQFINAHTRALDDM